MSLRLVDGSRVSIIGGGPAGSFAALHLLQAAQRSNLKLQVSIFEPRDFSRPGPGGCNRCAGILSYRLQEGLKEFDLALPQDVIQADVHAYAAHIDGDVIRIQQPNPQRRIVSVYRGGGPRLVAGEPVASFDAFLLSTACSWGAQHITSRVRKVTWQETPVVHTGRNSFPADLVVLATGVNSTAPLDQSFGYRGPQTEVMAQDEILRPQDWSSEQVQIYFRHPPGLIFGALIPKNRYLNVSLLGNNLPTDAVYNFLEAQGLDAAFLTGAGALCGCTPRVAVSPARKYYGDRWVAVGDAAVTRLYKDGIGSAFHTARAAMHTAVYQGISHHAFRTYYRPHCRQVAWDNRYGRLLFRLWGLAQRNPLLLKVWKRVILRENQAPVEERIHERILWGMFTGDEKYGDLLRLFLTRSSLAEVLRGFLDPAWRSENNAG
jgi:flavin-dependent dehydrogenase